MTTTVANDLVIAIHYCLKNAAGDIIDQSEKDQPMEYIQGAGNIIPGLEQALTGKSIGDHCEVTVNPEDAYGMHEPQMVQQVPREMFQGVDTIEVGMNFQSQGPDGQAMMITVTAVEEDLITIDGNHPLAGQSLHFAVDIVSIREATEDEKQHQHVHSASCNH